MPLYPDHYSYLNAMPSWLKKENIAGIKWAGMGEENPGKGLVQAMASIILNDTDTAYPIAYMDGTAIMAARTGAVAAIMGKYCAKKSSKVMTVIGAGVQATSALDMFMITMPQLEEIRVVDINPAAIDRYIKTGSAKYPQLHFVPYNDIQTAAKGSDILLPAAHGKNGSGSDLLDNIVFDKGTTIVGISGGLSKYLLREKCDWVIMDFIDCVIHRHNLSGKYMEELYGKKFIPVTRDIADGEIGDIIAGKIPGRKNDDDIVHAQGVGMSIEDIVLAYTVFERAKKQDIGIVVDLIN